MTETPTAGKRRRNPFRGLSRRLTSRICLSVIAVSVILCVVVAAARSEGLTEVKITASDASIEPRDHGLPLIQRKAALPDYQILVNLSSGRRVDLGTRPDTSAVDGLTFTVSDPMSLADIASIRLQDRDRILSDAIAEVEYAEDGVEQKGYRFEFSSERSLAVGVESFFATPIGMAIMAGFALAVLLIILASVYGHF